MNPIIKFFHELFHPHCSHCMELAVIERDEKKEDKVCSSCETLKQQLALANHEKEQLLNRLLEKPEVVAEKPAPLVTPNKMISWRVRQQMLEAEDRRKAQAMKAAAKPDSPTTEELEKELGVEEKDALHEGNAQV